jgi:uncharacterized protein
MTDITSNLTPTYAPSVPATRRVPVNLPVVAAAAILLAAGAGLIATGVDGKHASLYLLGGALGLVLYHALFGFTSAFRVFIADRRGAGLRAQMAMLALAVMLFFPALSAGSLFGHPVTPNLAPVGTAVLVGAFLFGIGMQLGGGCASGTLFAAGGGNTRMYVTLAAFIAGSVVGAAHLPWWTAQPSLPPISLIDSLGLWPALAVNLAAFAAIAGGTVILERRRHGRLATANAATEAGWRRVLQGPWPLIAGALGLAVLNFATLAIAGKPWGITSAFALWGSKLAAIGGIDVASWPYWQAPAAKAGLTHSVFGDVTSVMDFGIVLGALLASGLAGKFAPTWRIPLGALAAALIGGLLMGYGARLSYGCNIGAYFSGIASGSVHGWLWLVAALAGSVLGTGLRPVFGLAVERTARQTGC